MYSVIIIDDEVWVIEVIKNIIDWKEYGFKIINSYKDGLEGLEGVKKYKPNLVITDIRMPGMTGLEIIKEIAMQELSAMSVVISGYNDFEYAQTALTYGAIGYLLKPIDAGELIRVVEKALGILEQTEEIKQRETHIRKKYEDTVERLREQFFKNYFDENEKHIININEMNDALKLNFGSGCYRIMSLVCSNKANIEALYRVLNKAIWELQIPITCRGIVPLIHHYKVIIIVNYDKDVNDIISVFKQLFNFILKKKELGGITATLSKEFDDINLLGDEYVILSEVEYARLFNGKDTMYFCEKYSMDNQTQSGIIQPNTDIMVKQASHNNCIEDGQKIVQDAYEWLVMRVQSNPVTFYKGVIRLVDMLEYILHDTNEATKNYMIMARKNLEVVQSLEEIKGLLLSITKQIFSFNENADNRKEKTAVGLVVEYINKNYMHAITLTDMAQLVHLNANYLSEIFSRENNATFKEYLTTTRIEAAKELLCKSNYKLMEVSRMVGYNDTKNFLKIFKKYVGVSAKEYRKLMIGK